MYNDQNKTKTVPIMNSKHLRKTNCMPYNTHHQFSSKTINTNFSNQIKSIKSKSDKGTQCKPEVKHENSTYINSILDSAQIKVVNTRIVNTLKLH